MGPADRAPRAGEGVHGRARPPERDRDRAPGRRRRGALAQLQDEVRAARRSGRRTSRPRRAAPAPAFSTTRILNEHIGRSMWGQRVFGCQAPDAGNAEILHMFGTDEQKERWLQPLVAGQIRSFFSMTEPEVPGSDPTTLRTRAVRDGDDWVIDGHKWFSSGADGAAFGIVMAVTDPDAPPHGRATQIIVPADTPGRRRRQADPRHGARGQGLVDALRGALHRRPRAGLEHARRRRRRLPDRAEAARPGSHPPRDALARPDAARLRADVHLRARPRDVERPALRQADDPELDRGLATPRSRRAA